MKYTVILAMCCTFLFSFDAYSKIPCLKKPPISGVRGNQILHFGSSNKSEDKPLYASQFIETNFAHAKPLDSDAKVIRFASDSVTLKEGLYIEMGACTGRTINFIAALNPDHTIYGFDSFKGLPTEWNKGTLEHKDKVFKKETFAFDDPEDLPTVLHNVDLVVGLFEDTLPGFVAQHKGESIALLHVDSDVYVSARDTFKHLSPLIKPGTIITFDEYYHYPAFKEHEYKAFQEFMASRSDLSFEYIAYNPVHEQAAVRILLAA